MYIADDPMLALITRFMGDTQHLSVSDAEFLLRQITAIEQYVAQFPPSELQFVAVDHQHYVRLNSMSRNFPRANGMHMPWNGSRPMLNNIGDNGKKTRSPRF